MIIPDDTSIPNVLRQSIDLMGYFPALIAYAYQAKSSFYDHKSLHLHNPIPELSTSEKYTQDDKTGRKVH